MTEQTIFVSALDIVDPADRAAYLDRACAGDPALRRQVEALLAAHDRSGLFLDEPALEQVAARPGTANARTVSADERAGPDTPTLTSPDSDATGGDDLGFLKLPTRPGSIGRLDRYEVLEVLGRGGFGTVLRAFDDRLHRVVAIKVLAPQLATSGTARQRFNREAKAGAAIRDEHVVNIHEVSQPDEPVPYLVMEYVAGQTLQQKLDRTGPLSVPEILRIGAQIARGLAAAHATGHIHRDVKPSNILLENGVERVKLTDFGLARAADDASISHSGVVAGTPSYMAPEQAHGTKIDHRADLFSLGSVLYAMCTGHPPFRASTTMAVLKRVCEADARPVREVNPEVPEWLGAVIARLHAKDPAARLQSANEVADLLGKYQSELQATGVVTPAPVAAPAPAPAGRPSVVWSPDVFLGLIGAVAAGAGVIVYLQWRDGILHEQWPADLGGATLVAALLGLYGRRVWRSRPPGAPAQWGRWLAGAAVNVLGFLALAYYLDGPLRLFLRNEAKVALVDATHVGVEVTVLQDGAVVHDRSPGTEFVLDANTPAEVRVFKAGTGTELFRTEVPLRAGMTTEVSVARELVAAGERNRAGAGNQLGGIGQAVQEGAADGFVPLFGGKDLTGWATFPDDTTRTWTVVNGSIQGKLPENKEASQLVWTWWTLRDFHLRAQARVGDGGLGGILFRWDYPKLTPSGAPDAYDAVINSNHPSKTRTGSLSHLGPTPAVITPLIMPDVWFTYEVIARGDEIELRVNGQTTVKHTDRQRPFRGGHLALEIAAPGTAIELRKIEVKELPPAPTGSAAAAVQALRDAVAAKEQSTEAVQIRHEAGAVSLLDLTAARIELTEARVRLAEAERDPAAVRARLQDLVTYRQTERDLTEQLVQAGRVAPSALSEVDARLAAAKARLAQAGPAPTADPQPVRLRSFTPGKDPLPLPHRGPAKAVTVVGDAWRVENADGGGNFHVMVAQDLRGLPTDGVLVFRAKVKVEAKGRDEALWGDLGFGGPNQAFPSWDQWPPVRARYADYVSDWTEKEARYPAAEVHQKGPALYLYAGLHAKGVLWLKDVELLHLPAEPKAGGPDPAGRPDARLPVLLQSFPAGRTTVTRIGVRADGDSYRIDNQEPRDVNLFHVNVAKLPRATVDGGVLWLRAQIKTQGLVGRARPELAAQWADGRAIVADTGEEVSGTSDWAWRQVRLPLKAGERPDFADLKLFVNGKGTIWIKDVALMYDPPEAPAERIKVFTTRDVPLTPDAPGDNRWGWRIEAKADRTAPVFEVADPPAGPGTLRWRAKMKTEGVEGSAALEAVGATVGAAAESVTALTRATGTSDWAYYDVALTLRGDKPLTKTTLNVVIKGKGVVWIKDVELLKFPAADGFVPLFNGRDLAGWKTHRDQPGDWKVEDGVLVGRGGPSHLFTDRGDYADFHLRAEVKVSPAGDSGVWFRTGFDLPAVSPITGLRYPTAFEAQIIGHRAGDEKNRHTGSIIPLAPATKALAAADEWFTLEVIARGGHFVTKVNGQPAAEADAPADAPKAGHIALQSGGSRRPTTVQYRKIEIKELPPAPAKDRPVGKE